MYWGLDGRVFRRGFTISTFGWFSGLLLWRLFTMPLLGEEAHPFPKAVQAIPNAHELYQKAVGGDLKAQSLLGDYCYSVGALGEALHWYRNAAEKGHVPSAISLSQAYRDGRGVEQDLKEAERWLRLARTQKGTGTVSQPPQPQPPSATDLPSHAQPLTKGQNDPNAMVPTKKRVPVTQIDTSSFICSKRHKTLIFNSLTTMDGQVAAQPAFEASGPGAGQVGRVPELASANK